MRKNYTGLSKREVGSGLFALVAFGSIAFLLVQLEMDKADIVVNAVEDVEIPDVAGMSIQEAVPILQGAGFAVMGRFIYAERDSGTVLGTVFEKNPEGRRRQEIKLYVSIGTSKKPYPKTNS